MRWQQRVLEPFPKAYPKILLGLQIVISSLKILFG